MLAVFTETRSVLDLTQPVKCLLLLEARRRPEDVSMGLAELWAVMEQCIERGSLATYRTSQKTKQNAGNCNRNVTET